MFVALILAAATSVSAMFSIVEVPMDAEGYSSVCRCASRRRCCWWLGVLACAMNVTGMIPCQACGDSPTDQSFFGVSLCRSCKMTLRANKPSDDATFTRDRIIKYCEDYQRLFRLGRIPL